MTKFKGKHYKDLSDKSKNRLNSMLNRLNRANISCSQALIMDDLTLGKTLGITPKKKNFTDIDIINSTKPQKRVIRQLRASKERREQTIDKVYTKTYKAGYTNKQKLQLKKDLIRIAGNSFIDMSDNIASLDKKLRKTRTKDNDSYVESNQLVKNALLIDKNRQITVKVIELDSEGSEIEVEKLVNERKHYILKNLSKEAIKKLNVSDLDVITDYSP